MAYHHRYRDRIHKRNLYDDQRLGVYLLLDPESRTLDVYRRDEADVWIAERVERNIVIRICGDCRLELDRRPVFRE